MGASGLGAKGLGYYLRRLVDAPIQDERRRARHACQIPCYVFDADGIASSATILDRSEGGVRVSCPTPGSHRTAAYLLRLDTGSAYAVKVVWSGEALAGYEFRRRIDTGLRPKGIAARAVLAAWQEYRAAAVLRGERS